MSNLHFVQTHPLLCFSENDATDYSKKDENFIQCLKAMESLMDIDAYIVDNKTQQVLYATKSFSNLLRRKIDRHCPVGIDFLNRIVSPEELSRVSDAHYHVYDFFYQLPKNRRRNGYFTQNFKLNTTSKPTMYVSNRATVLDLTSDGSPRLTLCVMSYPSNEKSKAAYIKMLDTHKVYEFLPSTKQFIEIKTQKLTSKATKVLRLAGNGKNESEIADILGISINTVKYHKKRIFAQLGVNNTVEAIQWVNNQKKMIK